MFCNLKIAHPYYSVILKNFKEENRYVFVGNTYNNRILKKIENKIPITKKEIKKLDSILETNYSQYNWHEYKHPIKFIKYRIHVDDTVENLRNKIFIVLSTEEDYIIPNNQQLYLKSGRVFGNYFEGVTGITHNKFKIDKKFVDKDGLKKIDIKVKKINNVHNLIMDELDIYNKAEYSIYCTPLHDVLNRLKDKKISVDQRVKNGYLYKYYPKFKINVEKKKWEKNHA